MFWIAKTQLSDLGPIKLSRVIEQHSTPKDILNAHASGCTSIIRTCQTNPR